MPRFPLALVVASLAMSACSGSQSRPQAGAEPMPSVDRSAPRRAANAISEQELAASTARNALEAVQLLRPDWLRGRGAASIREVTPTPVVVYVDNQRFGNAETLDQFPIAAVKALRFLSASEATNRFGTGHGGGAITVTTR